MLAPAQTDSIPTTGLVKNRKTVTYTEKSIRRLEGAMCLFYKSDL